MPITLITEKDNSVELMRACQHDCSLGEFQHQLTLRINAGFIARAKARKERVNFHDLVQTALTELEDDGIIKPGQIWQKLSTDTLFPASFIQAIRVYNTDPKSFNLTKLVPEKPAEPEGEV